MNAQDINAMNPEELRAAVAKSNGDEPNRMWRVWYDAERQCCSIRIPTRKEALERAATEEANAVRLGYIDDIRISEPEEYDEWQFVPDYHESRDALAPVLAKLKRPKQFIHQLWIATGKPGCEFDYDSVWRIATATPEQMCKAYLKCLL